MSSTDNNEFRLETEIRRLKLQLLKEELTDKLFILNNYLDKKDSGQNSSRESQDQNNPEDRFESVLFANITEDILVWHIVLVLLIFWFLAGLDFEFLRFYKMSFNI